MRRIRMLVELTYNDDVMHGDEQAAIDWFFDDVLHGNSEEKLILHSNEFGDEIGIIEVLDILDESRVRSNKGKRNV